MFKNMNLNNNKTQPHAKVKFDQKRTKKQENKERKQEFLLLFRYFIFFFANATNVKNRNY